MVEESGTYGFLDAAAIAFLARRLHHRRQRAAAVRGLNDASAEDSAGFQTDVDHAEGCFDTTSLWTPDSASDHASTPEPIEAERVPPMSIVIMTIGSRGDVQ